MFVLLANTYAMIWWIWKRHIKCRIGLHFTLGKKDKRFLYYMFGRDVLIVLLIILITLRDEIASELKASVYPCLWHIFFG
jgi:hypothetical protein